MLNKILKEIDIEMNNCIINFDKKISEFNINNINLNLIYNLCIDYYGNKVKLKKLINITIGNNNTLKIFLFDKSIKNKVRNIIDSLNLNLTSNIDGNDIIINLPIVTESYKNKMLNLLKNQLELFKINIRNIRFFFRKKFISLFKKNKFGKDDIDILKKKLDKFTSNYINLLIFKYLKKKKNILN